MIYSLSSRPCDIVMRNADGGQEVVFCWRSGLTVSVLRCLRLLESIQPKNQQEFLSSAQDCCSQRGRNAGSRLKDMGEKLALCGRVYVTLQIIYINKVKFM